MVLESNIPDEIDEPGVQSLYEGHLPNYCVDCGGEIVVAGGRLKPESGWYDHLDPVLTCAECGRTSRHTVGCDPREGRRFRVAPDADESENEALFGDIVGYCDIHGAMMKPTKALFLEGRPMRQYKCPECDREAVVTVRDSP